MSNKHWWLALVDHCHEHLQLDNRLIFVLGTSLANFLTYWIFNAILYIFYRFNLFPEYRINNGEMPPQSLIDECLKLLFIKHLFLYPAVLYFAYPLFEHAGVSIDAPLPTLTHFGRDILINIFINDTLFYWAHRILHHPSIYQYIHKQHHRFNYTIGIAASYAHPVEDIIANLIPTIGGSLFLKSHVVVMWSWIILRLLETIDVHSGYSFPLSPFHLLPLQGGADFHDFHHHINKGCYGSFTVVWDWLCGTDRDFVEFRSKRSNNHSDKKAH